MPFFSVKDNYLEKIREIRFISEKEIQRLNAWYIENPFTNVPIDSTVFPVKSRFIVQERTTAGFKMGWHKNEDLKTDHE